MLKDEFFHFSLSLIAGVIVGYFFANWWAIPLALVAGFFIDVDHLIDYLIYKKFRRFDLRNFFTGEYFDRSGKVYVFAHGFEFAMVLIMLGAIYPNLGWFFYSLGFANLLHLLYDTFANGAIWPTYFFLFRLAKNFDHQTFKFPKCQK
jgi:hypothetical protein